MRKKKSGCLTKQEIYDYVKMNLWKPVLLSSSNWEKLNQQKYNLNFNLLSITHLILLQRQTSYNCNKKQGKKHIPYLTHFSYYNLQAPK